MLDRGIYRMEDYVEGGWLTGLKYEDEVIKDLEKRTDSKPDKLRGVGLLAISHIQFLVTVHSADLQSGAD